MREPLPPPDSITVVTVTPGTAPPQDVAGALEPRKRQSMREPLDNVDPDTGALFVQDRELHRRLCPSLSGPRFRALLKVWEGDGFPRISSLTGGRYWRAVVAWLDSHYGAHENLLAEEAQDGPEDFGSGENATTRESSRPQARPRPQGRHDPGVLDGTASRPKSNGLPRLVDPAPARR
jgi:hypothetical protein